MLRPLVLYNSFLCRTLSFLFLCVAAASIARGLWQGERDTAGDETCQVSCSLRAPVTVTTPDSHSTTVPTSLTRCFYSALSFYYWLSFFISHFIFYFVLDLPLTSIITTQIPELQRMNKLTHLQHLEIPANRIYHAAVHKLVDALTFSVLSQH